MKHIAAPWSGRPTHPGFNENPNLNLTGKPTALAEFWIVPPRIWLSEGGGGAYLAWAFLGAGGALACLCWAGGSAANSRFYRSPSWPCSRPDMALPASWRAHRRASLAVAQEDGWEPGLVQVPRGPLCGTLWWSPSRRWRRLFAETPISSRFRQVPYRFRQVPLTGADGFLLGSAHFHINKRN